MKKIEYVYKVNLPSFDEILLPNAKEILLSDDTENSTQHKHDPKEFLKENWVRFNNIDWDQLIVFYKNNYVGGIHRDTQNSDLYCGINWIISGECILEFWKEDHYIKKIYINDEFDNDIISYYTHRPPIRTYRMPAGVYLVNASVPHRASGIGPRFAATLRSEQTHKLDWKTFLNNFQNFIID
jgi:hypothetical protein